MGTASEQEQREVHCLSSIYPEIKQELNKIQGALEDYVRSIAVTPPSHVKAAIMDAIKDVSQEKVEKKPEAKTQTITKETKVVEMPRYVKLSLVASIAIVLGLGSMYVMESQRNTDLQDKLTAVNSESSQKQNEYLANLEAMKDSLKVNKEREDFVLNPSTQEVLLAGTDVSPSAQVRVYWNKDEQSLIVKNDALPKEGEGKQYQLWALADGKPIDLGVLDKDFAITPTRKIDISEFQAFAITLEKEGGSPTPTLEQLFVVGAVKG